MDINELSKPFTPSSIKWRVGSTDREKTKGMALAYADARAFMDRLDEVCGADGWQDEVFDSPSGRVFCKVSLKINDEWISKMDGAGETDVEGDKGAISDAFKRACVKWGLGRYLYDIDSPWVEIEQRGKSYVIKASEKQRLMALVSGNRPQQKKQPQQETVTPTTTPVQTTTPATTETAVIRKPSEAMLGKLFASGKAFYGDTWETKRKELVLAVTHNRTDSTKQLTFDECKKLIDGIEKSANG